MFSPLPRSLCIVGILPFASPIHLAIPFLVLASQATIAPVPTVASQACVIKGNISYNSEEKIYHVPGQQNYDDTVINEAYGERWFCTEEEARADGWRKAKR